MPLAKLAKHHSVIHTVCPFYNLQLTQHLSREPKSLKLFMKPMGSENRNYTKGKKQFRICQSLVTSRTAAVHLTKIEGVQSFQ